MVPSASRGAPHAAPEKKRSTSQLHQCTIAHATKQEHGTSAHGHALMINRDCDASARGVRWRRAIRCRTARCFFHHAPRAGARTGAERLRPAARHPPLSSARQLRKSLAPCLSPAGKLVRQPRIPLDSESARAGPGAARRGPQKEPFPPHKQLTTHNASQQSTRPPTFKVSHPTTPTVSMARSTSLVASCALLLALGLSALVSPGVPWCGWRRRPARWHSSSPLWR